jgi:hypothetical protein
VPGGTAIDRRTAAFLCSVLREVRCYVQLSHGFGKSKGVVVLVGRNSG